jgi:hypothetical protein
VRVLQGQAIDLRLIVAGAIDLIDEAIVRAAFRCYDSVLPIMCTGMQGLSKNFSLLTVSLF